MRVAKRIAGLRSVSEATVTLYSCGVQLAVNSRLSGYDNFWFKVLDLCMCMVCMALTAIMTLRARLKNSLLSASVRSVLVLISLFSYRLAFLFWTAGFKGVGTISLGNTDRHRLRMLQCQAKRIALDER